MSKIQVEYAVSRYCQCQVYTAENKKAPVKPSEIPETVWHTPSVDFGGLYPDGHYNLVVIREQDFPVIEQTPYHVACHRLRYHKEFQRYYRVTIDHHLILWNSGSLLKKWHSIPIG